jgi:hypothetical protein
MSDLASLEETSRADPASVCGPSPLSRYVPPSPERTLQMLIMRAQGMTPAEIAQHFGMCRANAVHHLRKSTKLRQTPTPEQAQQRVAKLEHLAARRLEPVAPPIQRVARHKRPFAHASNDVWTPERMFYEIKAQRGGK